MTQLAGPLRQIGLVVSDIDAAISQYTDVIGIGPFCLFREMEFDVDYRYMGTSAPPPVVSIAVGQSGPTQIEIIQQHNDAPSTYRDFVAAGGDGYQHLSSWFDVPAEYDAARQRLIDQGLELRQEGRAKGSPCRWAYFAKPGASPLAPCLEISEALLPAIRPLSETLQIAARTWTGTPRTYPDLASLQEALA